MQCEDIRNQTHLSVLPGRIRLNLDAECGSNLFCSIRRPTIVQEDKNENLEELIQSLRNGNQRLIKVREDKGILCSITVIKDNEEEETLELGLGKVFDDLFN